MKKRAVHGMTLEGGGDTHTHPFAYGQAGFRLGYKTPPPFAYFYPPLADGRGRRTLRIPGRRWVTEQEGGRLAPIASMGVGALEGCGRDSEAWSLIRWREGKEDYHADVHQARYTYLLTAMVYRHSNGWVQDSSSASVCATIMHVVFTRDSG